MSFKILQTRYQTHLSKVDPALITDLLMREQEQKRSVNALSSSLPFYLVEILVTQGTNSEKMRNMIYEKTGLLPSISGGTRYNANMRLGLELLKVICDSEEGIVKITGYYTGGVSGR